MQVLCRVTIVVVEQTEETVAALDSSLGRFNVAWSHNELIVESPMIALRVIMRDEFSNNRPKLRFTKRDDST